MAALDMGTATDDEHVVAPDQDVGELVERLWVSQTHRTAALLGLVAQASGPPRMVGYTSFT